MVSHDEAQLALRTKLLTLTVATTGSTTLAATATGYSRSSGSFVTDGFRIGMEVTGSGFSASANNAAKTLTAVSALALTCSGTTTEASDTRTLSVVLPAGRSWENADFEPTVGSPWVEEQYLPGSANRLTLGPLAEIDVFPVYTPRVYVPTNTGASAARKYADALIELFAPGTPFTLASGDTMRVRGDTAPFAGQLLRSGPSFVVVPVTVPLRLRTTNSI